MRVFNEDVMQTDLEELLAPYFAQGSVSVCANLPYYITTPILMKLLECGLPFEYITIMIQSEVADRFVPAPKVDSTVVRIKLHRQKPCQPRDEAMLFRTVKAAFGQRRKTLVNALGAGFPELTREQITAAIAACGHDLNIRGERLDIAQFTQLSDVLATIKAEASCK